MQEIDDAASSRMLDDGPCHHSSNGMACILWSTKDNAKHATIVFNRSEIDQIYANEIKRSHNGKLIRDAFDRLYSSSVDWNEEFVDKAGILGTAVCFNMFQQWGSEYDYDPSFGLRVKCEAPSGKKEAHLSKDELTKMHSGTASEVFYKLEQEFRTQYKRNG